METFQDDEFMEMSWNGSAVVTRWKKLCLSYEERLAALVILMAKHEGSRWIDDTTGTGCYFAAYTGWLRDVLLPPLVAAGLKRFAFIMPNYFGEAQLELTEKELGVDGLTVKAFNMQAPAGDWV